MENKWKNPNFFQSLKNAINGIKEEQATITYRFFSAIETFFLREINAQRMTKTK